MVLEFRGLETEGGRRSRGRRGPGTCVCPEDDGSGGGTHTVVLVPKAVPDTTRVWGTKSGGH